jgi:hypothetical protein
MSLQTLPESRPTTYATSSADQFGAAGGWPGIGFARQAQDYWIDACQRSVLFLDVLRRRGNDHFEYTVRKDPNVLGFQFEVVMDGRRLDRPVNYALVRIVPPDGAEIDPRKRPFIVFDPRAGHGPGIGGMKHDSEIGVVLKTGHPCYFVGFLPEPMPGQTVEDVCRAEERFVEKVAALHPEAEGRPCLIGNCQAGWQIMMMSAIRPDVVGPILLAGTPLSYWGGVHGKKPLRYLGGLLGGTSLTSLAGDLGHGIFDGAALVGNFESMNPSNTLWKKEYNLYSNIDTEAERYLEFEKWWGSPVLLTAKEMQSIADELFVGNKLTSGEIYTRDGVRVDLRNIKSPIVVFCSWGDDITPPQQALDWILDLYDSDADIVAAGQTIVYALHQSIGHLGIFVSAKVATKEHEEFAKTMDLIDVLPPGLYEAVISEKSAAMAGEELVSGNYFVRFERRTLNDIKALGGNDGEDELRFAAAARLSEVNQGLYRTLISPWVQACVTEQGAEWLRQLHPHRLRYALFSDRNPLMRPIADLAAKTQADRRPVAPDNPFLAAQEAVSDQIVVALDRYRDLRDQMTEAFFMTFYGHPLVQAMVGLRSESATARRRIGRDVGQEATVAKSVAALEAGFARGGFVEAGLRALIYIELGRPTPRADERGFAVLRQFRAAHPASAGISLAKFKETVREQYLLLRLDEERAMAAFPKLLPADAGERAEIMDVVRRIIAIDGEPTGEMRQRFERIEALLAGVATPAIAARMAPSGSTRRQKRPILQAGDSSGREIPRTVAE